MLPARSRSRWQVAFYFYLRTQKASLPVPEDQPTGEPQVGGALLEEQSKDGGKAVEELGGSAYPESPRSHLDTWTGEVLPHWVQLRTWTVGSSAGATIAYPNSQPKPSSGPALQGQGWARLW